MSRCFQPSCFSRRACLRRHSLKSGPGNGSVVMNHCVTVDRPMATEVEQDQHTFSINPAEFPTRNLKSLPAK
jgi:hypothetical protein